MKVLHLLTALGHGGAEIWLLNLIRPLRELGIEVAFGLKAAQLGKLRHVAHERGAATHDIPLGVTQIGYVGEIKRLVTAERYDIVHTHEFIYSGLGVFAGHASQVPTMMTLHHYDFEPQTPFTRRAGIRQLRQAYGRINLRYAISRANAITAFSTAVMGRMVPNHANDPRCRMLRLSVDAHESSSRQQRAALRASLGWSPSAPIIVHAGRFTEQKNHAGLLRVFRRVVERAPDARLILMGSGPIKDKILADAKPLIDAGFARYLGLRDDVPAILSASDLFLFPSTHEGFGLVALEANACGLPVVGSRIPGLDEAVVDGQTAILHELSDEMGMANSAVDLLRNPARSADMGKEGRRRAEERYSHSASAAILARVYRALVGDESIPSSSNPSRKLIG